MNAAFDTAFADYRRLREAELVMETGETMEEEARLAPSFEAALTATTEAFKKMILIPVNDGVRAASKVQAIADLYDLGGCGVGRAALDQVLKEVVSILKPGEAA